MNQSFSIEAQKIVNEISETLPEEFIHIHGNSAVFCLDCNIGMKFFNEKFFDLSKVDPPYGINATEMQMGSHPTRSKNDGYGSGPGISTAVKLKGRLNNGSGKLKNRILNTSNIGWDNEKPNKEYFDQLFYVSKNQIIWGGNYFELFPSRCWLIWDKLQPWENFSQFEMAWTSFDKPTAMFRHSNTGGENKETKIHPTQKPISLYDHTYKKFIPQGGKVLDTHLGSQSNRIAAYKRGNIEFIAFETDFDYFKDGNNRFMKEISLPLFDNHADSNQTTLF